MPVSSYDPNRRVVISGLGVVSPIGCELDEIWNSLQECNSAVGAISSIPTEDLPVRNGAEIKQFTGHIDDFGPLDKTLKRAIKKNQKVMCREIEIGVAACQKALHDCGIAVEDRDPERIGIVYGCDYILTRPEEYTDGIRACSDSDEPPADVWPQMGLKQVNPLWLLKYLPNMPASHVAIYNDLRGPSNSLTVREASSNLTLIEAVEMIRRGAADVMVAGATGSMIHPLRSIHIARQFQLGSDRDDPTEMARPFADGRDGVVLGEGAAAFVLESHQRAVARGAKIYGEVLGGVGATVPQRPNRDSIRTVTANMLVALKSKFAEYFEKPMHLHASGRSEQAADLSESLGIADVLGSPTQQPPVVSAKSYFGSLGAGGAAVEVAISCLALEHGKLFKTLNSENQSPDCTVRIAKPSDAAGESFVHLSYTPQGQASAVLIAKTN